MGNIFKKSWEQSDFNQVNKAIVKYINSKEFNTHHGVIKGKKTFNQIDNILGLAYTSSSSFACYSICNTELYLDLGKKFKIEFFALGIDNIVYIVCWDANENEIIISI